MNAGTIVTVDKGLPTALDVLLVENGKLFSKVQLGRKSWQVLTSRLSEKK